jgi:hypothetical protein
MWQAVENGNVTGLDSALKRGADPNAFGDAGLNEHHTLITAQASNNPKLVSRLLAAGADPTVALHRAINAGEAKRLIGIGAKVNGNSRDNGLTPLSEQSANGRSNIVQVLLFHGANPLLKDKDGYTPRQRALYAVGNHPEASAEYSRIIRLLDQASQPNTPTTTHSRRPSTVAPRAGSMAVRRHSGFGTGNQRGPNYFGTPVSVLDKSDSAASSSRFIFS